MDNRAFFTITTNVIIALFLCLFVYINFLGFRATGELLYLLISFNESLYVLLYLVRARAVATSPYFFDWGVAFAATFLSTLLRPAHPLAVSVGTALVAAGVLLTIAATLFLNRSIAFVAAERIVKTRGPYRLVRHPMYAGGMLSLVGYVLGNFSLLNVLVALAVIVLLVTRAGREEQFLERSEAYKKYRASVPWRFIPFVY